MFQKNSSLHQDVSELMDFFCSVSHPQLAVSPHLGFVLSLIVPVLLPQAPLLLP